MPLLKGQFCVFRPLMPADYDQVFRWSFWAAPYQRLHRKHLLFSLTDIAADVERLLGPSVALLGVTPAGETSCLATIFDANPLDRSIRVDIFEARDHLPFTIESWLMLLDYVFAWHPVDTVRRDLPGYAKHQRSLANSVGFESLADIPESAWFDGRFWDVSCLALRRGEWTDKRLRLMEILQVHVAADAQS